MAQETQQGQTQSSNKSSAETASPSNQPDPSKASSPDSKTQETSGPKSALDAVNAALGVKTESEPAAGTGDAAAAADTATADTDTADTGGTADGDTDAGDSVTDPAAAATGATEDGATDPDADTDSEATADDDFTPPQGLKERSTERWNKLVDRTKHAEAARDSLATVLQNIGAPRDELAQHIETLTLAYRGGPDGQRKALARLDELRSALARNLGVEVPGVDLLADYPDLQQQVEDLKLSRELALDIASGRRMKTRVEAETNRTTTEQQQAAQRQQAEQAAAAELDALGTRLQGGDIDYNAKFKILKDNGDIEDIMQNFAPAQWAAQFERRYKLIGRASSKPRVQGEQPLRTSATTGGGKPQPKSMLDAISLGIADAE